MRVYAYLNKLLSKREKLIKEVIKKSFFTFAESFIRETEIRASAHRNSERTDYGMQKNVSVPQK